MSSGDQRVPCTVCGHLGHWESSHVGDAEQLKKTRAMLYVVLDCIDYSQGFCTATQMVGAVISKDTLEKARSVL